MVLTISFVSNCCRHIVHNIFSLSISSPVRSVSSFVFPSYKVTMVSFRNKNNDGVTE